MKTGPGQEGESNRADRSKHAEIIDLEIGRNQRIKMNKAKPNVDLSTS